MPLWLACVLLLADLIALVYFRRQLRESDSEAQSEVTEHEKA